MKFRLSFKGLLAVVAAVVMSSCSLINGDKEPMFKLSDLQGYWQEKNTEHYVRFTTEKSNQANYLYGYEWDEAEDTYESDLVPHGNGWFKYWFETANGGLHELHLMDNDGSEIPKEYVVTKLTSTDLEYYEKERKSNKFYFSKVVLN